MMTRDEFDAILDRVACELPEKFYNRLNGGINVLDEMKRHPSSPQGRLYILGEYIVSPTLGRYIVIYRGSFMLMYPHDTAAELEPRLRSVLRHEFRHHLESLGGLNTLAEQDRADIGRMLGEL